MNDSANLNAREPGDVQRESSPPGQPAPAQASLLRRIFIGADGLRAGWSLLIFILILGLSLQGFGFIANKMHLLPPKGTPVREIPPMFHVVRRSSSIPADLFCDLDHVKD